jgi:hypothetical protein
MGGVECRHTFFFFLKYQFRYDLSINWYNMHSYLIFNCDFMRLFSAPPEVAYFIDKLSHNKYRMGLIPA